MASSPTSGADIDRADPEQVLAPGVGAEVDSPELVLGQVVPDATFLDDAPLPSSRQPPSSTSGHRQRATARTENRIDVPGFGVLPAAGVDATVERAGSITVGTTVTG